MAGVYVPLDRTTRAALLFRTCYSRSHWLGRCCAGQRVEGGHWTETAMRSERSGSIAPSGLYIESQISVRRVSQEHRLHSKTKIKITFTRPQACAKECPRAISTTTYFPTSFLERITCVEGPSTSTAARPRIYGAPRRAARPR